MPSGRAARVLAGVASACLLSTSVPAAIVAQLARGAIDGVVTDTALVTLAGATVSVIGTPIHLTTSSNGRFAISELPAGRYTLYVRRIGYAPLFAPVEVTARDTVRGSYSLRAVPPMLDTVAVTAFRPLSSRLGEFKERRRLGQGSFITQADIEKRNPLRLSDLFRTIPSVTVNGTAWSRRVGVLPCPFQFFVDGVLLPQPIDMDKWLPEPRDLAGIEVYAGPADIPLQYKTVGSSEGWRSGGFCGVILLWTKDGGS